MLAATIVFAFLPIWHETAVDTVLEPAKVAVLPTVFPLVLSKSMLTKAMVQGDSLFYCHGMPFFPQEWHAASQALDGPEKQQLFVRRFWRGRSGSRRLGQQARELTSGCDHWNEQSISGIVRRRAG